MVNFQKSFTVGSVRLFFLPIGDCDEIDCYQVSVARGSEVKKLQV